MGAGLFSCDVRGDITAVGRIICKLAEICKTEKTAVPCSFCVSENWNLTTWYLWLFASWINYNSMKLEGNRRVYKREDAFLWLTNMTISFDESVR